MVRVRPAAFLQMERLEGSVVDKLSQRPCRPVQDRSGSAVHGAGAALSGPHAEPAGGPAQREEDAALLPGVPAHGPPGGVLGLRPAQDQDGRFPAQVSRHAGGLLLLLRMDRRGFDVFCLVVSGLKYRTNSI